MAGKSRSGGVFAALARKIARNVTVRAASVSRPLTANEERFIETNRRFWSEQPANSSPEPHQVVLVHFELYPLALLGNLLIASVLARARNAGVLVVLPSRFDNPVRAVLGSFPSIRFEYEDGARMLFFRITGYLRAVLEARRIRTPDDLLTYTRDGLLMGDCIYDTVLAHGHATVASVSHGEIIPILASYFYHRAKMRSLMARHRIVHGVATHIVGVAAATFLRYLLQGGKEVYIRETHLKKYSSLSMMHECGATPDRRFVEFMKRHPQTFARKGEMVISERLGNRTKGVSDHLPYKADKVIYTSRAQFADAYGLDSRRRNVFVMLHAFNDYPHTYGMLAHRDFYDWFLHTLQLAQEISDVNWIFKDHPYGKLYPTDVDVESTFRRISAPQIRFLAAHENFNTSSLRYVADVVITCIGTAGLEYSTFGIPCILGGRCWYSGLGFTREPATREAFERELRHIALLERLTDEQTQTAKMMAYFSFKVMNHPAFPDPFRTIATYEIAEAKTLTSDELIGRILDYRSRSSEDEKSAYIDALEKFIANPEWVQFVDFAEHTDLLGALPGTVFPAQEATPGPMTGRIQRALKRSGVS